MLVFFFFKQKTAYEMRISDWSSDVCSSDLIAEEIAVSQNVGELSLSLRSIADNKTQLEEAIASGDVTVPDGDPKAEKEMLLKIASQPVSGVSTYSQGADVSRFPGRRRPRKAESGARRMGGAGTGRGEGRG